jgi:hypothetical protein
MCISAGVVVFLCAKVSIKMPVKITNSVCDKVNLVYISCNENCTAKAMEYHWLHPAVPHFRTYREYEGNWFLYSVNRESGKPWHEEDDVLNCNGVQQNPTNVCMQNFHKDWHCISNKYNSAPDHSIYVQICEWLQPWLQILPDILCIDKVWFTLYGISTQATFTLGHSKIHRK